MLNLRSQIPPEQPKGSFMLCFRSVLGKILKDREGSALYLVQCASWDLHPDATGQREEKAAVTGTFKIHLIRALTLSFRMSTPSNMPADIPGGAGDVPWAVTQGCSYRSHLPSASRQWGHQLCVLTSCQPSVRVEVSGRCLHTGILWESERRCLCPFCITWSRAIDFPTRTSRK